MPSPASLISLASSFLPSHSGVRPTISPPMNTASRTYSSIEYSPVPMPPKITSLAERLAIGTAPPMPVKDSIALFTAPHEVTVVTVSNSAEPAMPKRCSLPSMLPPAGARDDVRVQAGRVLRGRAVRLGDVGDRRGAEEHHHHHAVDRVALTAVAGHPPVHEHERRRDDQHEQHLEEVGERRRVLERVRRVDVEEAAAVGAELLDHLLRGHRAHRDRLRQAGDRVGASGRWRSSAITPWETSSSAPRTQIGVIT